MSGRTGSGARACSRFTVRAGVFACRHAALRFNTKPSLCADMVPLLKCLDAGDVKFCIENLNPWLQITGDGQVLLSEAAGAAFIGGSVGVIGSVASTMRKRDEVRRRAEGEGQATLGAQYRAAAPHPQPL